MSRNDLLTSIMVGIAMGMFAGSLVVFFTEQPSEQTGHSQVTKTVYQNDTTSAVMIDGSMWVIQVGNDKGALKKAGVSGVTDCDQRRIYISNDQNVADERDSILHELLHAGTCDEEGNVHNRYWNSESEDGHEGIYKISDFMSSLLHDNPELTQFLAGN